MNVIFLTIRDYKGNYMLEIAGNVYGKITGSNLYEICRKFSKSNALLHKKDTIYVDEAGFGKEFSEELEHSFRIHTVLYKARRFYITD